LAGASERISRKQPSAASASTFRADVADWKPGISARSVRIGALVLLLALISWSIVHKRSSPETAPVPAPAIVAAGTVIHDCPTCPEMTVLPAGKFNQGLDAAANATAFEMPAHAVTIGRPLAMATNDVTVDEFRAFVVATGRTVQGCEIYDGAWSQRTDANWENPGFAQTGSHPVTCVSWADANAYADWLTSTSGHRYRLPSASEWEYAARAGGVAAQPWVSLSEACAHANVADQSAARRYPGWSAFSCDDGAIYTSPVGTFSANAFGLKDMLGNVLQWTQDCWSANYEGAPVDGSPRTAAPCAQRELRGASWFTAPGIARVSYRNHFAADYRTSSVGIRLVRDVQS
jgi:formylglycine-generating enzyme required for sulfatase activity